MAQVDVRNAANGGPTKLEDEGGKIAGEQVAIHNKGSGSVFLGKDSATLTTSTGYELLAGEWLTLELTSAAPMIFAVAAVDHQRVDVLVI